MGNNVVITVGGKGRYFSDVRRLGIALQDGGESLWIDKSNTEADQIVGRDIDGKDYIVRKGSGGNIIKTLLPTEIRVVTPPHKTSYVDGEAIDYTGMVVKAYDAAGNVWTDYKHPDGVIPIDELEMPDIYKKNSLLAPFQLTDALRGLDNGKWIDLQYIKFKPYRVVHSEYYMIKESYERPYDNQLQFSVRYDVYDSYTIYSLGNDGIYVYPCYCKLGVTDMHYIFPYMYYYNGNHETTSEHHEYLPIRLHRETKIQRYWRGELLSENTNTIDVTGTLGSEIGRYPADADYYDQSAKFVYEGGRNKTILYAEDGTKYGFFETTSALERNLRAMHRSSYINLQEFSVIGNNYTDIIHPPSFLDEYVDEYGMVNTDLFIAASICGLRYINISWNRPGDNKELKTGITI